VTVTATLFTREDYARLPEGFPAQLIGGALVKEPAPRYGHQEVVLAICLALAKVVDRRLVLPSPVDVPIDGHNVFWPDVAVFAQPPPPHEGGTRVPRVVFEVLSPTTERRDRRQKRPGYLRAGVSEVWLLDSQARTIEVHSADGVATAAGDDVARSAALSGFSLVPSALFAPR
jgi:Uma2 family endonuclease